MEHLPVPHDCAIGNISVPFLANDPYTSPFRTYPQRNGWGFEFRGNDEPVLKHPTLPSTSRNIASQLQSWLYFGLLSEFLDPPVSFKHFCRRSEVGDLLLTSEALEPLVCERTQRLLEKSQNNETAFLESWRDLVYQAILMVRHYTIFMAAWPGIHDQDLAVTSLAISVMAEYLTKALGNLLQRNRLERPISQKWRIVDRDMPLMDMGLPILQSMAKKGWCPRDIALLDGTQVPSVSTLWYLANLSPPKADLSHSTCSAEDCLPLQLNKDQYVQAHARERCSCVSIGPDPSVLAGIIWAGKVPIFTVRDGAVHIKAHTPTSNFVAISHVWADGKGHPKANTLPLCIAQQLQDLANELPRSDPTDDTPVWIDTLCIPRTPQNLRKEALSRLRDPYEEANRTLVIDSYLRSHAVSEMSDPFEILGYIAVCGWSQRLWTFQEGRLPTEPARTWFAFRDKSVDLLVEVNRAYSHFPTLVRPMINLDLLFEHNQTQLTGPHGLQLGDDYLYSPHVIRTALRTRTTSVASDEALCLGTILKLPTDRMRKIINLEDHARMAEIWRALPAIPTGLAFSQARQKLTLKGIRWAPATFMGSLDLAEKEWEGPNGTWEAGPATILPHGLAIRLPTWIARAGSSAAEQRSRHLCNAQAGLTWESDYSLRRGRPTLVRLFLGGGMASLPTTY